MSDTDDYRALLYLRDAIADRHRLRKELETLRVDFGRMTSALKSVRALAMRLRRIDPETATQLLDICAEMGIGSTQFERIR